MDEYIRKQDAIEVARENGKKIPTLAIRTMEAIKSLPAADVVPVVRCWDCRYRVAFDKCCHPDGLLCAKANNFCNYGERKE